jgi:dTDP-4-dehydrorhamnose reductase
MRPILVAGKNGQLARCLADVGGQRAVPIFSTERPEFDLEDSRSIERVVTAIFPRAIVNAAAYTAVDLAESNAERAFAVNRDGAGQLAATARRLDIPFIHISTDYVFDGRKSVPYCEDDTPSPLGVYGQSKLEGEMAVMNANADSLVLRTAWLYSAYGTNFVKTMLRLAGTHDLVRVVDDQLGAPTSACVLASAVLVAIAQVLEKKVQVEPGIYHVTAAGETTWFGFASAIFAGWRERGRRVPRLEAITSADYPSAVKRPANSRLDCAKFQRTFGTCLPLWSTSLGACLDILADDQREARKC